MTDVDAELGPLSKVVSLAQEAAAVPATPEVEQRAREQFVASAVRHREVAVRRRRTWPKYGFVATAAAAALAVFLLRPQALSYQVRGGSSLDSPYVGARADTPAEITFSDGSEVQADPGSRLRIDDKQDDGARVVVERGVATARIVHRARSRWLFVAGPFEVRVTGTKLTLGWDPVKEELDLTLHEGSVEVRGPDGRKPLAVRAGQRLLAQLHDRTVLTEQLSSTAANAPEAGAAEPGSEDAARDAKSDAAQALKTNERPSSGSATQGTPGQRAKAQAQPQAQGSHRDSWQSLMMRGEFEVVIAAAQAKGIQACLDSCSAADLRSLADAARYANRVDVAEESLLALRQRFTGSNSSLAAAFLLGRTSEARGRTANAQQWYERYLEESPDGEFAADALAGQMRAVSALRGKSAARPLALEYLRRYPDGVHAISASRIAGPH